MEVEILLSFVLATVILALMPGPDNIYVLTESVCNGHKNGIAISLGLSSGVIVHTILAATGLSIILQQSEMAFTIVKVAGAVYLLYLAWKSYQEKGMKLNFQQEKSNTNNHWKMIGKGFLMNVLNPKVSLFFIAFLPQFVSPSGMHISLQMMVLGFVFMSLSFVVFSAVAILSGKLSGLIQGSGFWKTTKWIKVIVLSLLALSLLVSRK